MVCARFCLRSVLAFSLLSGANAQAQWPSGDASSADFVLQLPDQPPGHQRKNMSWENRSDFGKAWCDKNTTAETGAVGCLMKSFIVKTNTFWIPILINIWTLPVGILLIVQWHRYRSTLLRYIGKGIIVANIYYCKTWGATKDHATQDAFIYSCLVLFIDEVILYHVVHKGYNRFEEWAHSKGFSLTRDANSLKEKLLVQTGSELQSFSSNSSNHLERRAKQLHDDMKDQIKKASQNIAFNVYMDFRKPIRRAALTFVAQIGLFFFYVYELNGGNDDEDSPGLLSQDPHNFSALKWFFAIALIVITGDGEVGRSCNYAFWRAQIDKITLDKEEIKNESGDVVETTYKRHWLRGFRSNGKCDKFPPIMHVLTRAFFDFAVNGIACSVIKGTVPIMLAVEGPLDFVKDATAVFFVLKLDDIEEDKDLADLTTWDFSNDDIGYTFDEFFDPFYDCDKVNKPLKFPTRKEIIGLAEGNLEQLAMNQKIEEDQHAFAAQVEKTVSRGLREEKNKKAMMDNLIEQASILSEKLVTLQQEIDEMKKVTGEDGEE